MDCSALLFHEFLSFGIFYKCLTLITLLMAFEFSKKFSHVLNLSQFNNGQARIRMIRLNLPDDCFLHIVINKKENNFEVCLHIDSSQPVYVDFECKINNTKESFFNQLIENNLSYWGWPEFGTKEELFVDDVMTIEWAVKLKSEPSLSFKNIGVDLLDEEEFSDFTICSGEKQFKVHKNVLAAASPVFSAMFKQKFKEADENKVDITDFDAVIDRIVEWLLYNIKNATVCLIGNFAKKKEIKEVYDKCVEFCVKEFDKIYTFDNFKQFDGEIVKEILEKKLSVNT
uniref:BTB domain-containing protein n=1 Tax=Panagrolaimus sp. JU765 TaxID=591449 RepID=A0AC34Q832_9BILA